jgi:hypothetical protein
MITIRVGLEAVTPVPLAHLVLGIDVRRGNRSAGHWNDASASRWSAPVTRPWNCVGTAARSVIVPAHPPIIIAATAGSVVSITTGAVVAVAAPIVVTVTGRAIIELYAFNCRNRDSRSLRYRERSSLRRAQPEARNSRAEYPFTHLHRLNSQRGAVRRSIINRPLTHNVPDLNLR